MRRSESETLANSISRRMHLLIKGVLRAGSCSRRVRRLLGVRLYANSLYLMVNSGSTAGLSFTFWVLVARLYPIEAVGLGSALISAATMLSFLGTLGLGFGLIRFLPTAGTSGTALINSCFTISGLVAALAAVVFLAGLPLWSPALSFVRDNATFIAAFIAFVAVAAIFRVLDGVFVALRRAEFTLIKNLLQSVVKLALVAGLVSLFKVFGIFASWGLAEAASLGLGILVLLPRLQPGYVPVPSLRRQVSNEMVHFSFANYVSTSLWNAPTWLLPIMVVNLLGSKANAYFYMSWAMAGLLLRIPASTSLSLFAEGSYKGDSLTGDVRRSLKLIAVVLLPATIMMLAVGDKLLFVFGKQYSLEGVQVLWALAASALPASVNLLYLGIARVKKRLQDILIIASIVSIGTLVLSYVLLPHWGILGAGVSWLASHSMVALVLLPRISRAIKGRPLTGGQR